MQVDLHFPVLGTAIPADHGYELYAGVSRLVPALHGEQCRLRIGPIRGSYIGKGMLQLMPNVSKLRLRLPAESIPLALPLAGKPFTIGGHKLRLGVPQVRALIAAPNLIARLVVMKASSPLRDPADKNSRDRAATKRYLEPAGFLEAVRQELARRGIHGQADLPVHGAGPRAGQPCRHVLRIRGKTIVGFSVLVQGLTAHESVRLQEEGIGGRGKMGCGFFVAARSIED
jgi:CRISPR-associated endonuclease/helicase Cas3